MMFLASLLLALVVQAPTRPPLGDDRIPTRADVAAVEKRIVMPRGAEPLSRYDRIYTEAMLDGRETIIGRLILREMDKSHARDEHQPPPPRIRRGLIKDFAPIFGGGCGILILTYDIAAGTPPKLACHPPK